LAKRDNRALQRLVTAFPLLASNTISLPIVVTVMEQNVYDLVQRFGFPGLHRFVTEYWRYDARCPRYRRT
jgi:hypothetical protein